MCPSVFFVEPLITLSSFVPQLVRDRIKFVCPTTPTLRFPPLRENEPPPEIGAFYILDFFFKVANDIVINYKKKIK